MWKTVWTCKTKLMHDYPKVNSWRTHIWPSVPQGIIPGDFGLSGVMQGNSRTVKQAGRNFMCQCVLHCVMIDFCFFAGTVILYLSWFIYLLKIRNKRKPAVIMQISSDCRKKEMELTLWIMCANDCMLRYTYSFICISFQISQKKFGFQISDLKW